MKPKLLITFVILLINILNTNSNIIENVYGKVKNTTGAIKHDIKSWWSYGKGIVFGNEHHSDEPKIDVRNGEEHRGIMERAYSKIESGIHAVWKGVHHIAIGDDKNKSVVANLYDKVKNKLTRIKSHVTGERLKGYNNIYQNYTTTKETKPITEALNQFLFGNKSWNIDKNISDMIKQKETEQEDIKIDVRYLKEKGLAINNNVNNRFEEGKTTIENSANDVKDSITDAIENSKNRVEIVADKIKEKEASFKDRIRDTAADMNKLSYGN